MDTIPVSAIKGGGTAPTQTEFPSMSRWAPAPSHRFHSSLGNQATVRTVVQVRCSAGYPERNQDGAEEQVPQVAPAAAVLVPQLPRAGHGRVCEELPAGGGFGREWPGRRRDTPVRQGREGPAHHGLPVSDLRVPGIRHLPEQLWHQNHSRVCLPETHALAPCFDTECPYWHWWSALFTTVLH